MPQPIGIRPYRATDVDPIYEAARESVAEIGPWMPWCHGGYSRDDTIAWVEGRPVAWESETEFSFVIEGEGGRLLGCCGLNRFDRPNGTANLGYWVRTSATRQGVATAAVGLLRAWAFANTDFHRLEILSAVHNVASQRVARKSGAEFEGVLKQRLVLHGRRHDAALYSLLR